MTQVLHAIIEPGFFASSPVRLAAAIGAMAAIVSASVGVFTVIRGQAFAGEALADIGATGGASAYLVGITALWGFVGISVAAAGVMELIGIQRARGRDLVTGIVLGAGFGLAALFLYLGTIYHNTSGAAITILFGSIFALSSSDLPLVLGLGALVGVVLGLGVSILHLPSQANKVLAAIATVAWILWSVAYFVFFWSSTGQTPGDRVMQIRVLAERARRPIRPLRAVVRFGGLILAALPLLAGYVIMLWDDRGRCLQDRLVRTVVIYVPREGAGLRESERRERRLQGDARAVRRDQPLDQASSAESASSKL